MLMPEGWVEGASQGNGVVDAALIAYLRGRLLQPGSFVGTNVAAWATPDPAVAYGKLASGVLAPIRARLAMEVGGPAALAWAGEDEGAGRSPPGRRG